MSSSDIASDRATTSEDVMQVAWTSTSSPGPRRVVIAAGFLVAAGFAIVGPAFDLGMWGDGSVFSYAIAVGDPWGFHWHNISGRLFTYLVAHVPAEFVVAATRDAGLGILIYAALFFAAPLVSLLATAALDRSPGRTIFVVACASTALVCPLVFGCPTEVWMAHAVFWPALAICHGAPDTARGAAAVFVALLALVFTYEGAIVFALVILATLVWRKDRRVLRAAPAFGVAMLIWLAVKGAVQPDAYIAPVMSMAARHVVDPANLVKPGMLLPVSVLVVYLLAFAALRRFASTTTAVGGAVVVCAVLVAAYWSAFDGVLHAADRYPARTVLLLTTPVLGVVAALMGLARGGMLRGDLFGAGRLVSVIDQERFGALAAGAVVSIVLVHAASTMTFVSEWAAYRDDLRDLAAGGASDPALGDPRFVSAARLGDARNRLAWNSTTPYLSVLVAPGHAPNRLVIDPTANYVWISCETAKRNEAADVPIPIEIRRLVRRHACLHRP